MGLEQPLIAIEVNTLKNNTNIKKLFEKTL